jgi:hypothetical protein
MRKTFKFASLIALALIAMFSVTSIVQAAPAVLIGATTQPHPYESNPTAHALLGDFISSPTVSVVTPVTQTGSPNNARDRSLTTSALVHSYITGSYELKTFPVNTFTISSVDFRLKYSYPGSTDDTYRITYYVDPSVTLTVLQGWSTAAVATTTQIWSTPVEPNDGVWSWTDVSKIRFRIETTLSGVSDAKNVMAYEFWVRVYPAAGEGATPPTDPVFPPTYAYDGDIEGYDAKFGGFKAAATSPYAWTSYQYNGYFALSGFENTPATTFDIGWVDIKVRYVGPTPAATNPDEYRIVYSVSGTDVVLLDWTSASYAPRSTASPPATLAQSWYQNTTPSGGTWTWDDIAATEVRFETRIVGVEDAITYSLYEVWLSIYPLPLPPTSSPTMSVQPAAIEYFPAYDTFFVDVYVADVASMWGYTAVLYFDNTICTALEYYTYAPFDTQWPGEINNAEGFVSISMSMTMGEATGVTGFTPVARIYFSMDAEGSSTLELRETKLTDVHANAIPHTKYDGWVGSGGHTVPEFPLGIGILMALAPIIPIVYIWRLRKTKPKTLTTQTNPRRLKP